MSGVGNSLFAPMTKLMKAVSQRGVNGTLTQLYTVSLFLFNR